MVLPAHPACSRRSVYPGWLERKRSFPLGELWELFSLCLPRHLHGPSSSFPLCLCTWVFSQVSKEHSADFWSSFSVERSFLHCSVWAPSLRALLSSSRLREPGLPPGRKRSLLWDSWSLVSFLQGKKCVETVSLYILSNFLFINHREAIAVWGHLKWPEAEVSVFGFEWRSLPELVGDAKWKQSVLLQPGTGH